MRVERAFAAAGLVATVSLVALLIPSWLDYRHSRLAPEPERTAAATVKRPQRPRIEEVVVRDQPVVRPARPAQAQKAHVVFGAAGGSCWLQIRDGSASGPVLYEGVLDDGNRVAFTRGRLWIRIGAGENLEVTLNGRRVGKVPTGVADVLATTAGVRPV